MSNSRNIRRSVKRNVSAVSMAALGTVTVGGMLMATSGTAFAVATSPAGTEAVSGTVPTTYPGATKQAAASITLTLTNTFIQGDTIDLFLGQNATAGATESQAGTPSQAITFAAAPTVTVTNSTATPNAADVAPTLTSTLTTNTNDSVANKTAGIQDELAITIGNTANGTAPGDTYTITVSGIQYNLGASVATTPVYVSAAYNVNSAGGAAGYAAGTYQFTGSPVSNAKIQAYSVSQTPTGVAAGATAQALSNLVMKEVNPGTFPGGGTVVYTVYPSNGGAAGAFTGTATVTATGFQVATYTGGACGTAASSITVSPTTAATTTNGATATPVPAGALQFCVPAQTTATTGAGTITISGLTYNSTGVAVGAVAVNVGNTVNTAPYSAPIPAISVLNTSSVAGYTADDTAAKAAAAAATNNTHAVILTSDAEYQDALAASYLIHTSLVSQDNTGTTIASTVNPLLLNPYDTTNEMATSAGLEMQRLIQAGELGTVYIVGGTAAVSQDVQNQLSKVQIGTANGNPVLLRVVRIAGNTAEQTASMVAQYPAAGAPNLGPTPGAWGMYNSGASESTAGPTVAVPTAILADADEFQDALAASSLASGKSVPVLLNAGGQGLDTSAAAALTNLGVKQVYVIGGSAAISNQAVTDLQNAGIAVLRIAGTTFDQTANLLGQFEVNNYAAGGTVATNATAIGLNLGKPALTVGTSRGDAYQDALASAQVLGGAGSVTPLLLNTNTSTASAGTASFLSAHGTNAGFKAYSKDGTTDQAEAITTDTVFGGTLAQTPALVQSELNSIAGA